MGDNGAGERTLRGGPWAWCLSCSYRSMVPVTAKYSVWRKRWECSECKRPVDMLKCEKCGFEGGDATQLPAPKRPWGFQVKIKNGHKKVCPRCGDISGFPVKGETPSDERKGTVLTDPGGGNHIRQTVEAPLETPEGRSPAAAPESVTGIQGEPGSPDMENPGALKHTPSAETAGDEKKLFELAAQKQQADESYALKQEEESKSQKPSQSEE